jgi:hypothetical protein
MQLLIGCITPLCLECMCSRGLFLQEQVLPFEVIGDRQVAWALMQPFRDGQTEQVWRTGK